jgi:hypothetical protein
MAKNKLYQFRRAALVIAEFINYWSIIPCLMIIAYGIMLVHAFIWYTHIPTYPMYKCDSTALQIFINAKMDIVQAKNIACQVADTVGGPTNQQTTFISILVSLAAAIFGLYTANRPNMSGVNFNQLQPNADPHIMKNDNGDDPPDKPATETS